MAATHLLQAEDEHGQRLSLELLSRGLTVHKLLVERPGNAPRELMCGPEHPSEYEQEGRRFKNQVVGRYTNRLLGGQISVKTREGDLLILDLEKNDHGKNCLHSGSNGYDLCEFVRIDQESAIVREFRDEGKKSVGSTTDDDSQRAFFHLHSPAGHQGFPEAIDILATVTLTTPGEHLPDQGIFPSHSFLGRLSFSLQAKICEIPSDPEHPRPRGTPINLTWHNGYIMNRFDQGDEDLGGISQYKLWIDADHYLETDEDQLPTGNINDTKSIGVSLSDGDCITGEGVKVICEHIPKEGFGISCSAPLVSELTINTHVASPILQSSSFSLSNFASLRPRTDHCLIFKAPGNTGHPKVSLRSPTGDLIINFQTNQTAVQCYSSNFFDGTGYRKTLHRNASNIQGYGKQEALYLEFQQPNAICQNEKLQEQLIHNGRDNSSILYPGEIYLNWFTMDIYAQKP